MIDIIIPFYNSKPDLFEKLKSNIHHLLNDGKISDFRIILVNDGSTVNHYNSYISEFKFLLKDRFLFIDNKKNKGKGGAIKDGMKSSSAEIAVFYDIDFPFGISALYDIIEKKKNNKLDLVIARRVESYYEKLPLKRKIISRVVRLFANIFSKGKILDSQAGLKAMNKKIVPLLLNTKCNSFLMDLEFLLMVSKNGVKLDYIDVIPNDDIEFSDFSSGILWNEVKALFKIMF